MSNERMTSSSSSSSLLIGGTHGHVEEFIEGDALLLWRYRDWKPIKNCTGRYTCRERKRKDNDNDVILTQLSPLELLRRARVATTTTSTGMEEEEQDDDKTHLVQEFGPAPGRTDRILVLPLDKGQTTGLITYVKDNLNEKGSCRYVHTLNAPSGFQRKLEAVGIQLLSFQSSSSSILLEK